MTMTATELDDELARSPLAKTDIAGLYWAGGFTLHGENLRLPPMTAGDRAARGAIAPLAGAGEAPHWQAGQPDVVPAAPRIDHLDHQTPVKSQLDRLTCACFATVAAMEAILKSRGAAAILSEQYAGRVAHPGDQCLDATEIAALAAALEQKPICEERFDKYENRWDVTRHCSQKPSKDVTAQAKYRIGSYQAIPNAGLSGPSVANPAYLETLLSRGSDIVAEIEVAFDPEGAGIQDVRLVDGKPMDTGKKHALLIVGYDRRGATPFFICKNSYGPTFGYQGYFLFSYRYMSTYAIRGLIVESVQTP